MEQSLDVLVIESRQPAAPVETRSTQLEHGVSCAIRAGLLLVEDGTGLDEAGWTTVGLSCELQRRGERLVVHATLDTLLGTQLQSMLAVRALDAVGRRPPAVSSVDVHVHEARG